MLKIVIEALGFLGGAIGVFQALPQAWRIRKLGHGFGVSLASWALMLARSAAWLGYSLATGLVPLVISNAMAAVAGAMVVVALMTNRFRDWFLLVGGTASIVIVFWLLPTEYVNPILLGITLFARVPQLMKTWKNRNSGKISAVSLGSLAMSLTSLASWEIYFILLNQTFLILTTKIALIFTLLISGLEYFAMKRTRVILSGKN